MTATKFDFKGQKIVVTGGAGFIGSHLVEALLRHGAMVIVVDNLSTGKRENLQSLIEVFPKMLKLVVVDVNQTKKLVRIFTGAQAILHQAALPSVPRSVLDPLTSHASNATGLLSVLVAAKEAGVRRVIYASSSSVYGDAPVLPKDETLTLLPLSPYAVQKLTNELYARIFYSLYGLETIGLRYFNVFGPRQDPYSEYSAVIPKFISLLKQGKRPTIFGDGKQTRDFTYVDNVVKANLLALQTKHGFGRAFNIAAGARISLNRLVRQLNVILGTRLSPVYAKVRPGDIKDSFASIALAKKFLAYKPSVTFVEGLERTVAVVT